MLVARRIPVASRAISRDTSAASDSAALISAVVPRAGHLRQTATGVSVVSLHSLSARMRRNPVGFDVWHGSPHKFSKLDIGKIGTGEGAQAKGHGLYFAEVKDVALDYAQKLARGWKPADKYKWGGKTADQHYADAQRRGDYGAMTLLEKLQLHLSKGETKRILREDAADSSSHAARALDLMKGIPDKVYAPSKGYLYSVRVKGGKKTDFLDMDKTLSQQNPAVRAKLERSIPRGLLGGPNTTGEDLYIALARGKPNNHNSLGKFKEASNILSGAGLRGMRYLDKGSREAGVGSSNLVLFNDRHARIIRRVKSEDAF
jgi:hypothetical protein